MAPLGSTTCGAAQHMSGVFSLDARVIAFSHERTVTLRSRERLGEPIGGVTSLK
jgi:hypothetical protein